MKKIIRLALAVALLFAVAPAQAQKLHMAVDLQNTHLWRGIEVANGFIVGPDISISDNADHFRFGMWGGMKLGTNTQKQSEYKEFDYYMQYQYGGFKATLWDFNSFSGIDHPKIFNYSAPETNHFLDLALYYTLPESFPLTLGWSTILWGNDRFRNYSDNGTPGDMQNVYSTYVSADMPIWHYDKWSVAAGLGAAFALNPADNSDSASKYSTGFAVVQTTVGVTYDLTIKNYHMPITVTAWFNPEKNDGHLQLNVRAINF